MKIHDISLYLEEGMIIYPDDPEFKIERIKKIPRMSEIRRISEHDQKSKVFDNSVNVSKLNFGAHTGTHIDSKLHIKNKASGVDKIPLEKFYGKCRVLDLTKVKFGEGIKPEHLRNFKINRNDIVLLKTRNSSTGYKKFRMDFIYLSEEGAEYLVKKKIKTVGIDYLSIEKFHARYCAAHQVLLNKGIPIFEGLDLSKVKPGIYLFIGLPLKIKDCDGAPARAILIGK